MKGGAAFCMNREEAYQKKIFRVKNKNVPRSSMGTEMFSTTSMLQKCTLNYRSVPSRKALLQKCSLQKARLQNYSSCFKNILFAKAQEES